MHDQTFKGAKSFLDDPKLNIIRKISFEWSNNFLSLIFFLDENMTQICRLDVNKSFWFQEPVEVLDFVVKCDSGQSNLNGKKSDIHLVPRNRLKNLNQKGRGINFK